MVILLRVAAATGLPLGELRVEPSCLVSLVHLLLALHGLAALVTLRVRAIIDWAAGRVDDNLLALCVVGGWWLHTVHASVVLRADLPAHDLLLRHDTIGLDRA